MPPRGSAQGIDQCAQTPFLNPDPFQQWHGAESSQGEDQWRELYGPP